MTYSHFCNICKYQNEDSEILKVCPDCSSTGITNDIPIDGGSDDFIDEGDPKESFSTGVEENV